MNVIGTGGRIARLGACMVMGATALVLTASPASAATSAGAVISNGTVMLGVNANGSLNYDCAGRGDTGCPPNSVQNVREVGLRFQPLNLESTAGGCLCEGWGVGDGGSGLVGGGTVSNEAPGHTTVESFSSPSPTEAISTVRVADPSKPGFKLQVVHDYHSTSLTPRVFIASVKIKNIGTNPITDLRYRRDMDWDIEPTAFHEWVTIQGTAPSSLRLGQRVRAAQRVGRSELPGTRSQSAAPPTPGRARSRISATTAPIPPPPHPATTAPCSTSASGASRPARRRGSAWSTGRPRTRPPCSMP